MAELSTCPVPDQEFEFKQACKRLMIEICKQIKHRISLDPYSILAKL